MLRFIEQEEKEGKRWSGLFFSFFSGLLVNLPPQRKRLFTMNKKIIGAMSAAT